MPAAEDRDWEAGGSCGASTVVDDFRFKGWIDVADTDTIGNKTIIERKTYKTK